MRLTPKERDICRYYSTRDKDGKVHCYECPLVLDKEQMLCKKNKEE